MSTSKALILAFSSALLAAACGSDSEASPDAATGGFTDEDASIRADSSTSTGGKDGGKDGGTSTTDPDGGVTDEGDAGETETDAGETQNCDGAGGCYACAPKTNAQFLNQCVPASRGITAVPFDNQARIPNYDPSKLPDLP